MRLISCKDIIWYQAEVDILDKIKFIDDNDGFWRLRYDPGATRNRILMELSLEKVEPVSRILTEEIDEA